VADEVRRVKSGRQSDENFLDKFKRKPSLPSIPFLSSVVLWDDAMPVVAIFVE
jgi:hypothetical protein